MNTPVSLKETNDIKSRRNRKEHCKGSKIINYALTLTEVPRQLSELEGNQELVGECFLRPQLQSQACVWDLSFNLGRLCQGSDICMTV